MRNVDPAELAKFERLAARWWDADSEFRALHQINPLRLDFIDRKVSLAGKSVLDVGCGTGLVGVSLSQLGFVHLDGLDFSSHMLKEAQRKGVYRELIQADLNESLDLTPSTYGAAISCGTFTHGHVDANALDRIAPLLKPGAIFACTIHQAVWEAAGFARTLERLGSNGTLVVEEIYERAYFDGSGPDGRFCLLRRCTCNRAVDSGKG